METVPLPTLPPRKADSHKGDYGKVLVIAGSETMIGAPGLTALGALRAGSGLVRIATPKEIIPAVLTICPYATAFPWAATRIKELLQFADQHDALAVGPGLGTSPGVKRLVLELIERHHGPMVLDADALNVLAGLEPSEWPKRRNWGNIVMTPHTGEYMRLMAAVMKRGANVSLAAAGVMGSEDVWGEAAKAEAKEAASTPKKKRSLVEDDAPSTADGIALDLPEETSAQVPEAIENGGQKSKIRNQKSKIENLPSEPDRTPLAELLARGTGSIVVLKGHRTVITDGSRVAINTTGNPAMATAGSGDVLTGIIASFIGQRLAPLEAAVLGAHVHGHAGDLARNAFAKNAIGLLSTDIIHQLPTAIAARIEP
ncbi:MAG: NAD(P)H-hydrate dehydratase [Phycisphaerales bacterium]|nr:NAD(P)H-hydrate dehydratase [Phycisphaerales bacterium]